MKKKALLLMLSASLILTGCKTIKITIEDDEDTQATESVESESSDTKADSLTESTETATTDDETEQLENNDENITESPAAITIKNPSWDKFNNTGLNADDYPHLSLTKTKEESQEWLDTDVWCQKNGFEYQKLPYSDGTFTYMGLYPKDDYSCTALTISSESTGDILYYLDLYELCYGPDESGRYSQAVQDIQYAVMDDNANILYVSIMHNGYSSENPLSSHIVAIDLQKNEVIWRSEPLVSGLCNFIVDGDTIICGYGFTSEPDYIYLLDKHTGDKVDEISVKSAPEQFDIKGDTLYVATYNTAYEFTIQR
ncbi:hypothetical protein [Pseudobutyrivibrio ruminis]|uniref:hypothetical protein n=1 Tax=Pseudobutyrivibrio ruminis TaxID=46206 RepID=UPI00051C9DD8|nr:hypothetical protein [Pseudobutyrivibrio ruminis]